MIVTHVNCMMTPEGGVTYGFYMDENNRVIERTPDSHPYSYDSYMLWRRLPNSEVTGTAYSDRMMQWKQDKYFPLWESICGKNQYWSNYSQEKILEFVRAYFEDPTLEICYVMQCCNQASGFPLWFVAYKQTPKETVDERT